MRSVGVTLIKKIIQICVFGDIKMVGFERVGSACEGDHRPEHGVVVSRFGGWSCNWKMDHFTN